MNCILALEASSDFASAALWQDGKILAHREFPSKRSLSADLFPVLWELLENAPPIARIVVGLGPGSYAGVRITIAAAIGLQSVLGGRLEGIPSVAALGAADETFQAIGDARRGTWYYTQVVRGLCVEGPLLLDSAEALRAALAAGQGPVRSSETLPVEWACQAVIPRAGVLAELAALGIGVCQEGELEPLYLRPPHITLPAAPKGA